MKSSLKSAYGSMQQPAFTACIFHPITELRAVGETRRPLKAALHAFKNAVFRIEFRAFFKKRRIEITLLLQSAPLLI